MPISINGTGTITGISAGGLPDLSITTADIADSAITTAKIAAGAVVPADLSQPLTLATAQNSTSGTAIDFTGIPSWVRRITVMFSGVSTNGSSVPQIQLGDSGGIETTGYLTSVWQSNTTNSNITSGFGLRGTGQMISTAVLHGHVIFTLLGSNTWVGSGVIGRSDSADSSVLGGSKTTTDTLDRIRITTVNGTDTFDAGSINIMYEG